MALLASLIAGLILNAAFEPVNVWFCAPLALTILLYLLHDRSRLKRLLLVFFFGVAFYLPLLSWSNTYVGNVPWLILTLLQIAFLLPLALIPFSFTRPLLTFAFPSVWIGLEWGAANIPFGGFGWGRAGFSQAGAPYATLARFGGVPSLSFFVACLAVALLFLVKGESGLKSFRIYGWSVGGVLALVVYVGLLAPIPVWKSDYAVAGVQGGVPQMGLDFNERAKAVFQKHKLATEDFLAKNEETLEVLVWPENSVDIDPFSNVDISDQLNVLTTKSDTPLIFGAVTTKSGKIYNESILWESGLGATTRYAKQHLTPFGEYIPWRSVAEFVSPYAASVSDFTAGNRAVTHRVGRATIAPVICYELLDDSLGRVMTQDANFMIVQTNNATFGLGFQSAQQLNISRIRAIEHQRFVLSISTTGVSAFIDPRGKVSQQTFQNQTKVISQKIGLIGAQSISDRYGSTVEAALILPALILCGFAALVKRRRLPV